ncbi:MAG: hypothetical protein PHG73_12815 [Pygmaiobacter sp.]|nr:hypothetical protein [Pygmaiobacter sp.]
MAYKRQTREEKERMHRRRRRQLLGGVLSVLIVLGAISLITAGVRVTAGLFDDTEERQQYEKLLAPVVMLDPVPFDSLETADQNMLLQAAIWEAIYNEDITKYDRDEGGALILPVVDVDKNAALLLGKNYVLEHHTFSASGMEFVYDEDRKGYIIPITGTTSAYTPEVVKIKNEVQQKIVTVGYVAPPTGFSLDGTLSTEQGEPAFYYDYVFTRQDEGYYLTAMKTSDTKPASEAQAPQSGAQDDVVPENDQLAKELQQQADSASTSDSAAGAPAETTGD